MAEPKTNELMEKIVSLCKRRGFIYQSSEIYGGINGFWDYGPLGAELKRNVKESWWRTMVHHRDDVVGLEATIIMAPQIWKASGHVDTFSDPMCDCLLTKKRFRADQVEPQTGSAVSYFGALNGDNVERDSVAHSIAEFAVKEAQEKSLAEMNHELLIKHAEGICGGIAIATNEKIAGRAEMAVALIEGNLRTERFVVLIPAGKPIESARRIAVQFYEQRGVRKPTLLGESKTQVENSQRFNPENGALLTEPRPFNLMFKTYVGPVPDEENVAYLRPETAQAIFAQFKNVLETCRQKVPFGIAQVGKAFRNEVTPRNFTFRSREFEQMELEFFIRPDEAVEAITGNVARASDLNFDTASGRADLPVGPDAQQRVPTSDFQTSWGWEAWHKYWVEQRMSYYESIGLPRNDLVEYWQKPEELAHYARATVDILYKFPFSKRDDKGELMGEELEGIAARSDFDLSQHERFSGKSMGVFDEDLRTAWGKLDEAKRKQLWQSYYDARLKYLTKAGVPAERAEKEVKEDADGLAKGQYIPHVIEPSAGADRLILALICNAYSEVTSTDEKGKSETRVVMKFHPRIAPIKVGVFPLLKNKPELVKKAQEVRDRLRPHMTVFYDEGGAIGRRYARQDEAGTPFGVTVDFETLGEAGPDLKDTVTLRDRDTTKQERVKIAELLPLLLEKIR